MKLNYAKISETLYKFFWEGEYDEAKQEYKHYGEFYIDIKPEKEGRLVHAYGTAEFQRKSPDYAMDLLTAFAKELLDVGDDEKITIEVKRTKVIGGLETELCPECGTPLKQTPDADICEGCGLTKA